jgi:hypothetical protein
MTTPETHREDLIGGIMPVIEDHPPSGLGISARYAGDRGAECLVQEPRDHIHNMQKSVSTTVNLHLDQPRPRHAPREDRYKRHVRARQAAPQSRPGPPPSAGHPATRRHQNLA